MVIEMKIIGIIVEYNPLHNGHLYHFNKIKEENPDSKVIAVMSSSFTMRGDLSIFDKFTKTNHALKLGIDIVIELPFVYTVERADIFAQNAVKILNLMNVNEIWIGSEENNTSIYEKYYNEKIQIDNKDNYNIELKTIKRIDSSYLDLNPKSDNIASALAIRINLELLNEYTPIFVNKDINKILDEKLLFNYLKYKILNDNKNELKSIFFVDEGLENKLYEIKNYNSYDEFINSLVSKRYTKTRIKRMLTYILFNIKKDEINKIYNNDINFVRILGFNNNGKEYINKIKKDINIYTNIKENINEIFDIELKISKILDFIFNLDLMKKEQSGPIKKE